MFDLNVDGKKCRVIPREVQLDPVKDLPVHVDFQRVGAGARIRVNVPVRFINEAPVAGPEARRRAEHRAPRGGGDCPADAIPEYFEFNLEGLEIGRSIHISAVKMPEGVRPTIHNRDFTVATIAGHKIEEEPTPGAEAAAVEGAVPAEGEEGARRRRGSRRPRRRPARRPRAPRRRPARKPPARSRPRRKPAADQGKK